MREILFKAKRLDNGEWVEGHYMNLGNKYHYILTGELDITIGQPDLVKYSVVPETICQFTGLYDGTKWESLSEQEKQDFYNKNCSEDGRSIKYQSVDDVKHLWKGKKIWENDIAKIVYDFGFGLNVERMCWIFFIKSGYWLWRTETRDGYWLGEFDNCLLEVVGNSFDNPELL